MRKGLAIGEPVKRLRPHHARKRNPITSPEERDPLLMSSGGRIILSSTRGSCTDRTQPSVRLSTDRGQTFRTLKLNPRPSAVLALEVVGGESMLVIGADDRCRPGGYETRDGGRTWEKVDVKGTLAPRG